MTRKVYPDNASRQKAYRERIKKKQRERWETIFKKAKTIQSVKEAQASGPIEPSSEAKDFNEEVDEDSFDNSFEWTEHSYTETGEQYKYYNEIVYETSNEVVIIDRREEFKVK